MKKPRLHITDHAVLRYLERVLQQDVEALRAEIAKQVEVAGSHDGCTGVLAGGFRYRIEGSTVITVVPTGRPRTLGRVKK